jgi:hypothetical protein
LWLVPELATWLPKQVFPDAVPAATGGQPGSVLDDLLKVPPGGTPSTSGSPLDQLLEQPVAPPPSGSDPVLDRLRNNPDR